MYWVREIFVIHADEQSQIMTIEELRNLLVTLRIINKNKVDDSPAHDHVELHDDGDYDDHKSEKSSEYSENYDDENITEGSADYYSFGYYSDDDEEVFLMKSLIASFYNLGNFGIKSFEIISSFHKWILLVL